MLEFHKSKNASATIAVINVPLKEASRFGIMNTNPDYSIYEFEEKPKNPKSTNASMGIYIFNAKELYKYLEADEADKNSENDFGKNIIPNMLKDGLKMYAYPFEGYWKDVGTIKSLWEANMDLLGSEPKFNIFDKKWKFYSRNDPFPPHLLASGSSVKNSIITVGSYVEGEVNNSLLGASVRVRGKSSVNNSVVFDGTEILDGAYINYAIIAENCVIKENARIEGTIDNITVIGEGVTIEANRVVKAGEMIE